MNAPRRQSRPEPINKATDKNPSGKGGGMPKGGPSVPTMNQFGQTFVKKWRDNKPRKTWGA